MDKHILQLKVAVLAYFEQDGKILLQKRKNTGWRDGWYGFVSGHAEPGESFSSALCREVEEEAGVKIREEDLEFGHLLQLSAKISEPTVCLSITGLKSGRALLQTKSQKNAKDWNGLN